MSQLNSADEFDQSLEEEQPVAPQPQPRRTEIPAQKQKTNVYTVMLIVSFICIVTACILLYWELTMWGSYPWWNTDEGRPTVWQAAPADSFYGVSSDERRVA